jgi:hypothetical protein
VVEVKMKYFAYGSNLSIERLRGRVPSAKKLSTGCLRGHSLRFHKESIDGSGKCDAYQTNDDSDEIWGVVFNISDDEKELLDRAEGLGHGYELKTVSISCQTQEIEAVTYYATRINPGLKPYNWYKNFVVSGAKKNNLPNDYVELLERIEATDDPDAQRRAKNKAILKSKS